MDWTHQKDATEGVQYSSDGHGNMPNTGDHNAGQESVCQRSKKCKGRRWHIRKGGIETLT